MYEEALQLRRTRYDNEPDIVADTLESLAAVYTALSKLAEAEPLHEEAMRIRRRMHDEGNVEEPLDFLTSRLGYLSYPRFQV